MKNISIKELLDAGIHFGHRTNRWNPKMSEFIFGQNNKKKKLIDSIKNSRVGKKFKKSSRFLAFLTLFR